MSVDAEILGPKSRFWSGRGSGANALKRRILANLVCRGCLAFYDLVRPAADVDVRYQFSKPIMRMYHQSLSPRHSPFPCSPLILWKRVRYAQIRPARWCCAINRSFSRQLFLNCLRAQAPLKLRSR